MPNPYGAYRAIRTSVSGHRSVGLEYDVHEYDSRLEARFAELLISNGIRFKPHVKFSCCDRNIENPTKFFYTVDFVFETPQKLKGITDILNGVEVKGVLVDHDHLRIDSMKFHHQMNIYIALPNLVDYWARCGLLRKTGNGSEVRKK